MASHIGRRKFLATLGGAAVALPLAVRAQQAGRLPTIGFLGAGTPSAWSQWVAAFAQRLHELGWSEGRTIAIKYRWAEARTERYAEIAAEFVRLKVDVIVTGGAAVPAVKQATSVIPTVFAVAVLFALTRCLDRLAALPARYRIPAMSYLREFAYAGGLMTYGSSGVTWLRPHRSRISPSGKKVTAR